MKGVADPQFTSAWASPARYRLEPDCLFLLAAATGVKTSKRKGVGRDVIAPTLFAGAVTVVGGVVTVAVTVITSPPGRATVPPVGTPTKPPFGSTTVRPTLMVTTVPPGRVIVSPEAIVIVVPPGYVANPPAGRITTASLIMTTDPPFAKLITPAAGIVMPLDELPVTGLEVIAGAVLVETTVVVAVTRKYQALTQSISSGRTNLW